MGNITAVILTYNEERHIKRCITNIKLLTDKILVVDCNSIDDTCMIAKQCGAEVVNHEWPGTQAKQLNWALCNISFDTEWILRIDADEYLSDALIDEIKVKIPELSDDVTGIVLHRKHIFLEREMQKGKTARILRLFRYKKAICEDRLMDEYINLLEGHAIDFKEYFYDHNLNGVANYCQKHINYAVREAAMELDLEYNLTNKNYQFQEIGEYGNTVRKNKNLYSRFPLFWRGFAYFFLKYFVSGSFLRGKEVFAYNFIQKLWYRNLIDTIILDVKYRSGDNKELVRNTLKEIYNIKI